MNRAYHPYWRNFWVGLAGFCLGGIIGALSTFLIFSSGVMDTIAGFVSPGQPYVRFLFGIVLAFVGISLGGAIDGLVCGYTLHLIDPGEVRRRYFLGGAFSTGASQGILVIPIILFISLLSIYNVGSQADPATFVLLFALVGGLFGFVNGGILAFSTLRIRFIWIAWLAYFIACVAGGALFGLIIWRPAWLSAIVAGGYATPLFLVLAGALIYGSAGGMMGLVYTWLNRKRISTPGLSLSPRLWQDITTVIASTAIFLITVSFINRLATFVTIYQGSVTTRLSSSTEGVHWLENELVTADVLAENVSLVGLSARINKLVLAWSNGSGEILLSIMQYKEEGAPEWSKPLNASISPPERSNHPQAVLDEIGRAHIVWSEDSSIWYNQCDDQSCGAPVRLSGINASCNTASSGTQDDWPTLAISQDGRIMVAWDAGGGSIGFSTWDTTIGIIQPVSGCLNSNLGSTRPRVATGASGEFWLVISGIPNDKGKVSLVNYSADQWSPISEIGDGSTAEIFISPLGSLNFAWCGNNRDLQFLAMGNKAETVPSTKCMNRPSMFTDSDGYLHMVYAADQWQDNFGNVRTGRMLMESIQDLNGWSEPTIIASLTSEIQQEIIFTPGGEAQLAWIEEHDDQRVLWHTTQPEYRCQEQSLSDPMKVILNVIQNGNYHPDDYQPPFCGNQYEELVFLPCPFPEFAVLPAGEQDGFDQIASLMQSAEYEILFSNMQWDEDVDNLSPGSRIAQAISNIHQKVKANPESFPRGMTIKILLGNYPNLSTLQMGDQIWNVLQDITDMGRVPMADPSIGWKLELANYKGTFPHSHTKFIVVDGKTLMAGGFNIAWVHLPKNDSSGKGGNMTDLGITISGPIAQTGIEVFDEMWQGANQLVCNDPLPTNLWRLQNACTWETATISHNPDTLMYYLPGGTDAALGLYRSADYKESDDAIHTVLQSARDSIDILHANFTAELICDVNMVFPGVCNYTNSLPFMRSLVSAIQNNGVIVRVLVEETNMNGMENRVGLRILQDELTRQGLADHLEVRLFDGRLHSKSVLIDERVLIIGSQNLHYSSIAEGGLNEFNLVIDSPEALADYQRMFDYYWQHARPASLLQPGGFVLDW